MKVLKNLHIEVVTLFLISKVTKWWEKVLPPMAHTGPITWQSFYGAFPKHYFLTTMRLQKMFEFDNLKSFPISLVWNLISHYHGDETLNMQRFTKGLSSWIQYAIAVYEPGTLKTLWAQPYVQRHISRNDKRRTNLTGFFQLELYQQPKVQEFGPKQKMPRAKITSSQP